MVGGGGGSRGSSVLSSSSCRQRVSGNGRLLLLHADVIGEADKPSRGGCGRRHRARRRSERRSAAAAARQRGGGPARVADGRSSWQTSPPPWPTADGVKGGEHQRRRVCGYQKSRARGPSYLLIAATHVQANHQTVRCEMCRSVLVDHQLESRLWREQRGGHRLEDAPTQRAEQCLEARSQRRVVT